MKEYITTLPIAPWKTLSSIVSPYIWSTISKQLWKEFIPSINMIWEKQKYIQHDSKKILINDYISNLNKLWINNSEIRLDKDNIQSIKDNILNLYTRWSIIEKETNIEKCKCWLVEKLPYSSSYGTTKKMTNESWCCKFCWSEIQTIITNWLFYKINANNNTTIYPIRYKKFFDNYYKNFQGKDILISRTRNTWLDIQINHNIYNIDVDFFRENWLVDLQEKWKVLSSVISNPSSLYNTFLWINILNSLKENTNKDINIIVHPYINFIRDWNILSLKSEEFNIEHIIQSHQEEVIKLLIWCGLKRWKDRASIDIWLTKRIEKIIRLQYPKDNYNIYPWLDELLKDLNGSMLNNSINGYVGKKKIASDIQNKILSLFRK